MSGCHFGDIIFNHEIQDYNLDNQHIRINIEGANFEGSMNAVLFLDKIKSNVLENINFKDSYIIGSVREETSIKGSSFKGGKGVVPKRSILSTLIGGKSANVPFDKLLLQINKGKIVPIPIYINSSNSNDINPRDFSNVDFSGSNLIGDLCNCKINGASFDGTNASIFLGHGIEYDERTNFTGAFVYDKDNKLVNITPSGQLSSNIDDKLSNLLGEPSDTLKKMLSGERILTKQTDDKAAKAIGTIVEKLEELSKLDHGTPKSYGTYSIPKIALLVKEGDHYKLNDKFIPYIRFLNLIGIDFTDVDVRGIDFRYTKAVINPQTVYNKDISGCTFDAQNLMIDADLTGKVIYEGTNFDECSDLFRATHGLTGKRK